MSNPIKLSKLLKQIEKTTGKKIILEHYQMYNANEMAKFLASLKGFTNLQILYTWSQPSSRKFSIKQIFDFIKKNPKDTTYYIWNYTLDKSQESLYNKKLSAYLAPMVKKRNFALQEKQKNYDLYLSLQKPEDKEKKAKALAKFREYEAYVPMITKKLGEETMKFDSKIDLISDADYNSAKEKLESIKKSNGFELKDLAKVLSTFTPKEKKVLDCLYLGHTNKQEDKVAQSISKGGSLD